jgi:hypothetical protein
MSASQLHVPLLTGIRATTQRRTPFFINTQTLRFQHVTKAFQSNDVPSFVLPVILNFDRNRTVESHSQFWGVCHSLAETCGFIIENPLAGQVSVDWFSLLPVI